MSPVLQLASTSPRRQEILRSLGLTFTVIAVEIDESRLEGETPQQMVLRLAANKAAAAAAVSEDSQLVIGADTLVVLGDRVLGKPRGMDDAVEMLMKLSGRSHTVLTGVALWSSTGITSALSQTEVRFREIGRDEARAYWHSGEPCDKAGSYAIQGRGGTFVAAISGSYSGVVGLPVYELAELLGNAGIEVVKKQTNATA
ncbi:MAG: septum formation inhibitor Maf [Proteobacteria bacterium]|nr:septum formation inhibitor Maf [Pseudomonadota bacterium]MCH8277794.1 septum formation inhibitor Maf [Pseudomonadota bacterium]